MHLFWESVVKPLLSITQPSSIVEIGSDCGANTLNLLGYVQECGGVLHVIDPVPKYSVEEWQHRYGEFLVFHKDRSLDALPKIERMDVVLIDGDHNWYTVYNELKMIEENAVRRGTLFPLVILHDVGWPYGRRDLYYDPESIPAEFRKVYERKGIRPGQVTLQDEGGLNSHLWNAIDEDDRRNGVLTAVEDFMEERRGAYELMQVPVNFGLGVLYSKELSNINIAFSEWVESINVTRNLRPILEMTEHERVRKELETVEMTSRMKERSKEIDRLREQISRLEKKLAHVRALFERCKSSFDDMSSKHRWVAGQVAAVKESWRWRIGNNCVRVIEILLRRRRPRLALDEIEAVARESTQTYNQSESNGYRAEFIEGHESVSSGRCTMAEVPRPVSNHGRVDIIVPVFNALRFAGQCLLSVLEWTTGPYRIVIVNDGSDAETSHWLRWFSDRYAPRVVLLENDFNQGYTRSINRGIQSTESSYIVLLNSDTVVTPGWLDRLCACADSDGKIGIVGPLSNAASWQNVPTLMDADGGFAVNELPPGWNAADMGDMIAGGALEPKYPRVPFVNGFCYLIKSEVVKAVGLFDADTFPQGYGEENDYSLRCSKAGFELAIADDCYVFHSKSQSFGHQRRKELSRSGKLGLESKYDLEEIQRMVSDIKNSSELEDIRMRIADAMSCVKQARISETKSARTLGRIVFLLPVKGGGGGAHSVVQEASAMRAMGFDAVVAVPNKVLQKYLNDYSELPDVKGLFTPFFEKNLLDIARDASVVIATVFHSVRLLSQIKGANPNIVPAYYIQDYEPWFFDEGTAEYQEALSSYNAVPGFVRFAKTRWLCEKVDEWHEGVTHRVMPSIDHQIYYPTPSPSTTKGPLVVAAMVRPETPRRGAARTMQLLRGLANRYGEEVRVDIFGCSREDIKVHELDQDFHFTNHGEIKQTEVARILAEADVFLDLSDYQAFGRTAAEAMACGCVPVITRRGGADEFVKDRENGYLVDVNDEADTLGILDEAIDDRHVLSSMRTAAIQTVSRYSKVSAALSELVVLQEARCADARRPESTDIVVLPVRLPDGTPTASGYVRMILPYLQPSLKAEYSVVIGRELPETAPAAIVVQRSTLYRRSAENIEALRQLQEEGTRIILDLDDDMTDATSLRNRMPDDDVEALVAHVRTLLTVADAVFVTTPALAERINMVCRKPIYVIPNALDNATWFDGNESPFYHEGIVKIGFMGSYTHEQDLAMLHGVIARIRKKVGPYVEFELIGGSKSNYTAGWNPVTLPRDPNIRKYPRFVQWLREDVKWHIGLAPLRNESFNECKSPLKYFEYSGLGLATICSDRTPFRDVVKHRETGILVPDSEDAWYDAILELIEDAAFRDQLRHAAYGHVVDRHTLTRMPNALSRALGEVLRSGASGDETTRKQTEESVSNSREQYMHCS